MFWENYKQSSDIRPVVSSIADAIKFHAQDTDIVVNLVGALAAFARPGDAAAFKEAGMFDTLRDALAVIDDEMLDNACAQLIDSIGGAAMVSNEMQNLLNALRAGDAKGMNDAMESLNLLLLAHADDPEVQLELEEHIWPLLMERLQQGNNWIFCSAVHSR